MDVKMETLRWSLKATGFVLRHLNRSPKVEFLRKPAKVWQLFNISEIRLLELNKPTEKRPRCVQLDEMHVALVSFAVHLLSWENFVKTHFASGGDQCLRSLR